LDLNVANTEEVDINESEGTVQTLLEIVPENPFSALAEAEILQIIFFAVFIGLGITLIGEKGEPLRKLFDSLSEVMFWITGIIMRFAPIGVIGLVAPIIGEYGASVLLPLLTTSGAVAVACLSHAAIVYATTVRAVAKINPLTFFKGIAPAAAVAFSTASSAGTLPVTLKNAQENLGVSNKISSFVLPLGATINMD